MEATVEEEQLSLGDNAAKNLPVKKIYSSPYLE